MGKYSVLILNSPLLHAVGGGRRVWKGEPNIYNAVLAASRQGTEINHKTVANVALGHAFKSFIDFLNGNHFNLR